MLFTHYSLQLGFILLSPELPGNKSSGLESGTETVGCTAIFAIMEVEDWQITSWLGGDLGNVALVIRSFN